MIREGASAPFYLPQGDECEVFSAAHANGLPLLLKGPTGCGKTRFVAHMAAKLGRALYTVLSQGLLIGFHVGDDIHAIRFLPQTGKRHLCTRRVFLRFGQVSIQFRFAPNEALIFFCQEGFGVFEAFH